MVPHVLMEFLLWPVVDVGSVLMNKNFQSLSAKGRFVLTSPHMGVFLWISGQQTY